MSHKGMFTKSVLYSAIIASLYTASGSASAEDCPAADDAGNIYVSPGTSCSGGIAPDEPVNDIGIEGVVEGDVVNNAGIADYWMDGGTVTGSYINHGSADEVLIANASEVSDGLINTGTVENGITVSGGSKVKNITNEGVITADAFGILVEGDAPEGSTKIDGSIVNVKGGVIESDFNGIYVNNAKVQGLVINKGVITTTTKDHAPFANGIHIKDALINKNVKNNGTINSGVEGIMIDGSTIRGYIYNKGELIADSDGLYIGNAAVIKGDVDSSGSIRAIRHDGVDITDSTIEGSIILSGVIEAGDNAVEIDGGFFNGGVPVDGEPAPFVYTIIGGDIINSASLTNVLPEGDEYDEVDGGDGFDMDFVDVGGSLINSGAINVAEKGFDLEDINIAADFNNSGSIAAGEEGISIRYDGIDGRAYEEDLEYPEIGPTEIGRHFINSGNIESGDSGILLEQVYIGKKFKNSGDIVSDNVGIKLDRVSVGKKFKNTGDIESSAAGIQFDQFFVGGKFKNSGNIESGDAGIQIGQGDVGGKFKNTGDIESGAAGIRLDRVSIGESFENSGAIRSEGGSAIDIRASSVAGDFINTANLTANADLFYKESDYYSESWGGELAEDGNVRLTSMGIDSNGNAWFRIRNESTESANVYLDEYGGDFVSEDISVAPGEVIYINTGDHNGGNETHRLFDADGGGQLGVKASGAQDFTPQEVEATQRGISLTGNIYADDGALLVERPLIIEGSVRNTGDIDASDEGIYIENAVIGGNILNSGAINAGDDGIVIRDSSVNAVVNSGAIEAGTVHNDGSAHGNGIAIYDASSDVEVQNTIDGSIAAKDDGIQLSNVDGNVIVLNEGTVNALEDGIDFERVSGSVTLQNSGSVTAGQDAVELYNSTGNINILNTHLIKAENESSSADTFDFGNNEGDIAITNVGTMVAGGTSGSDVFDIDDTEGNIVINNEGTLESVGVEGSDGNDVFDINGVQGNLTINNTHSITAGTAGDGNDALDLDDIDGNLTIVNDGTISASEAGDGNNALDIGDVRGADGLSIINTGTISASGAAIDLDSDSESKFALTNTGTIVSSDAAAIAVSGAMESQIVNYGTISGGIYQPPEAPEVVGEEERELDYSRAVAIDYRFSDSSLNFLNDQSGDDIGVVEGDIYGSGNIDDLVELAAGQYNNNIYDVEKINITGLVSVTGDIFSLDGESRLSVADTGMLSLNSDDQVNLEGEYSQQGGMALVIKDIASQSDPVVDVTGEAELGDGSVLRVSLEDQDLSLINSAAGSREVHLIYAGQGLVDNGLEVQSDSILFNYDKFERASETEGGEEFGLIASVNSLGDLAAAGGADNNIANAMNSLQGEGSAGLLALQDGNPELYNDIYNATEESLAALGSSLLASPDTGVVASLGAQSEALNTILARIAELRSGVTGISAGDGESSDKYRPDALWMRAIYSDGNQDAVSTSNGSFNAYTLRSTGFTMGADKDVTDNLTLGAGFSHATSTVNEQALAQSAVNTETSSYIGSLYASWRNQSYFVDATFNYGVSKNDLRGATWATKFDASQFGVSVLAGRGFLFSDNDALLEPQLGFNYTRLDSDAYSYNSGVDVTVGAQKLEAIELGAGLRFTRSFEVGNGVLLPEASLMVWHDFSADSVSAELEFDTGDGSFTYFGPEGVKNRYQAGFGMEYLMDNNVTLTARYDRNWQRGFGADTWTAKVRYDF